MSVRGHGGNIWRQKLFEGRSWLDYKYRGWCCRNSIWTVPLALVPINCIAARISPLEPLACRILMPIVIITICQSPISNATRDLYRFTFPVSGYLAQNLSRFAHLFYDGELSGVKFKFVYETWNFSKISLFQKRYSKVIGLQKISKIGVYRVWINLSLSIKLLIFCMWSFIYLGFFSICHQCSIVIRLTCFLIPENIHFIWGPQSSYLPTLKLAMSHLRRWLSREFYILGWQLCQ